MPLPALQGPLKKTEIERRVIRRQSEDNWKTILKEDLQAMQTASQIKSVSLSLILTHTHSHFLSLSFALSLSLILTHTHILPLSLSLSLALCLSLSHFIFLSLSYSLSVSIPLSFYLSVSAGPLSPRLPQSLTHSLMLLRYSLEFHSPSRVETALVLVTESKLAPPYCTRQEARARRQGALVPVR